MFTILFIGDNCLTLIEGPAPVFIISNFSVEYSEVFNCIVWPFKIKLELTIKSPLILALPL